MRPLGIVAVVLATALACTGDDAATPVTTTTEAPAYPTSVDAVPSSGCGRSTAPVTRRERQTIKVGGEERWYLLSTPGSHDGTTPMPLVVEFHGLAEGANIAAEMSQLDVVGEREGFVSVYPNGSGSPVRWNESLAAEPNADFDFVDALLDRLGTELCIDEARIYATGLSYGAIMSSSMACTRADRFAAIAAVAGVRHPEGCEPTRNVPVLAIHGTADPILFFNGGVGDLRAALGGGTLAPPDAPVDLHGAGHPAAMDEWAKANGCGASEDARFSAHIIDRAFDCAPEAEVRFFIVEGGGHSWPSSSFSEAIANVVGPTTKELDATEEIWAFFARHALTTVSM